MDRLRRRHRATATHRDQTRPLLLGLRRVDPGRHHRHTNPPGQRFVDRRSEDHVGFLVHFLADAVGGLIDLEQGQIVAAGDVDQQATSTGHAGIFQQRIVDRGLGGADGAVFAVGLPRAHHRLAHLRHHRADIGEVQVHQPMHHHQVGDAAHAHVKHLVGHLERILPGGALIGHTEQVLIGDNDQSVNVLLQLLDPLIGGTSPTDTFEPERLGHHADGQDVSFPRHARNDGRRASPGATAHAGGDEHHMGAIQMPVQLIRGFFRGGAPDFRLRARPQPLRNMRTQLNPPIRSAVHQLLRIGVGDNEIHALQIERDHVVDGIRAAATHPDHRDSRREVGMGLLRDRQV